MRSHSLQHRNHPIPTAIARPRSVGAPAPISRSIRISTAIAIKNARTGLSRRAAAIDHVAQVGRLFTALPPADTDLGYLAPLRSTPGPAVSPWKAGRFFVYRLTSGLGRYLRARPQLAPQKPADRAAIRSASPGLAPTAVAMIPQAKFGRLSIGVPRCTNLDHTERAMVEY